MSVSIKDAKPIDEVKVVESRRVPQLYRHPEPLQLHSRLRGEAREND